MKQPLLFLSIVRLKPLVLLLAALSFACSESEPNTNPDIIPDPAVTLSIDIESKEVNVAEGSFSLTVTCNSSWTASSNKTWVTLTPASGSAGEVITVSYSKNPGSSSRSAVVTFSASGHTATLNISQTTTTTATTDPTKWLKLISDIRYASDGFTETMSGYYTYDGQGREIGSTWSTHGKLWCINRDYVYDGKELIYLIDNYDNDVITSTTKRKVMFLDDYRIKLVSDIRYAPDGVTEAMSGYYTYDGQGREIGSTWSTSGKLWYINRDYVYNGNELTYLTDNYYNDVITSTTKRKVVFLDDYQIRLISDIRYGPDGVTETMSGYYTYDGEGREIGSTWSTSGKLWYINRDYLYNGKEVIYLEDNYSNGAITSTTSRKVVYY